MIGVRVSANVAAGRGLLTHLEQVVRSQWWTQFAPVATAVIERDHQRRFASQKAPDGTPWAPLSPITREISAAIASGKVGGATKFRRRKGGGWTAVGPGGADGQRTARVMRTAGSRVMTDTGTLMRSVTASRGKGSIRITSAAGLIFGTDLKYAGRMHRGWEGPTTARQRGYLFFLTGKRIGHIKIPARPFVGISAQGLADLSRAAQRTLKKVIG